MKKSKKSLETHGSGLLVGIEFIEYIFANLLQIFEFGIKIA